MDNEPLNLNDMTTSLGKFADKLRDTTGHAVSMDDATSSLSRHYDKLNRQAGLFVGLIAKAAIHLHDSRLNVTRMVDRGFNQLFQRENINQRMGILKTQMDALRNRMHGQLDINLAGKIRTELTAAEGEFRALQQQLDGMAVPSAGMERVEKSLDGIIGTFTRFTNTAPLLLLRQIMVVAGDYGKSLIQANSALEHRHTLLKAGLNTQMATGANLETVLAIQRELVARGFDERSNYEALLKTSTRLVNGLGLSVSTTGRLAAVAASAKTPFDQMANSMSRIVDYTATAADEAARYAEQITKAALGSAGIGRGSGGVRGLTGATELLSRVEGALKGTAAEVGSITTLVTRLSRYSDLGGVGMMLGTGGTDFLQGGDAEQNIQRVLGNLNKFVASVGATGPALETLEEMLGVDRATLHELNKVIAQNNVLNRQQTQSQTTLNELEKRYRRQLVDQGDILAKLWNQLKMIVVGLLAPAIQVLRGLSYVLDVLMSQFGHLKFVLTPLSYLFSGVVLITGFRAIVALTGAIVAMAQAAFAARGALLAQATASRAGMATGLLGGFSNTLKGLGGRLAAWAGTLLSGGFFSRMLGSVLRATIVPLLTRLAPLLLGFLPGLIITAVIMLWPYLKKWMGIGVKEVKFVEDPNVLAKMLANQVAHAIRENDENTTKKLDFAIDQYRREAMNSGLNQDQVLEGVKLAMERAAGVVRVQGGRTQLTAVNDPAQTAKELAIQNKMLDALNRIGDSMFVMREKFAQDTIAAENARKKAADEEQKRKAERAAFQTKVNEAAYSSAF